MTTATTYTAGTPMQFVSHPVVIEAMQWNGPHNLRAFQEWLAPVSPMYRPPNGGYEDTKPTITVPCYDAHQTLLYPSLGKQFKEMKVHPGQWVAKLPTGDLLVLTAAQLEEAYQPSEDHLRQVNEEIAEKYGVDLATLPAVPEAPAPLPEIYGIHESVGMTEPLTTHPGEYMGISRDASAPGDDVDPTTVVDTSHVQKRDSAF